MQHDKITQREKGTEGRKARKRGSKDSVQPRKGGKGSEKPTSWSPEGYSTRNTTAVPTYRALTVS